MPTPGTLNHLRWLEQLSVPEDSPLHDPHIFLAETQATRSLGVFIRNQRIDRPLRFMKDIVLDSRFFDLEPEWPGLFVGSVNPNTPHDSTVRLTVHGQTAPQWQGASDLYAYKISAPIYRDFTYDANRELQVFGEQINRSTGKAVRSLTYSEMSQPNRHSPNSPDLAVFAFRQAASDLLSLMEHIIRYGLVYKR